MVGDLSRAVRAAAPGAAMAACLALGLVVGRAARPSQPPIVERGGVLLARGALARALDRQLALDGGPIRIGLTFRNAAGRWCRTFASAPDRLAGLACREPQGWTAQALAVWSPPQAAGLRAAAGETPEAVLSAVRATMAGAPADQAGERAGRDRGWTP